MKLFKLGEVCKLVGGGTPSKTNTDFYLGEIPWATVRDMRSRWLENTEHKINEMAVRESSTNVIPAGNVVLASRVGLGKVVQLRRDTAINQDLRALVPREHSNIDSNYIYYWTLSISSQIVSAGKGATVQGVTLPFLENLEIPVPSIDKQKKIVEKLDSAFAEIDLLEESLELSDEKANQLQQSLLSASFTPVEAEIEPSNSSANQGIAMTWREVSLKQICDVDWGNTKLTKSSYVANGKFLAVSAAGTDGLIDHFEHEADVPVLSAIGAQCGRMFYPGERFTAIKNTITLTPKVGVADGKFLYYLFTDVELPQRGAGQPFISKGDIEAFRVVIPESLKEQRKIVEKLDSAFAEIQALRSKIKTRQSYALALRQSLLSSAFSQEEAVA